jgi:hypothetical protein
MGHTTTPDDVRRTVEVVSASVSRIREASARLKRP